MNKVDEKLTLYNNEAKALMLSLSEQRKKYHYIDLDPFGPPTPFLDAIWSTLSISGMASITATDTTALCGVYPKACLRKYGSLPLNNHHTHETGARILISAISKSAARQGYGIIPIFTLSADHYFKVFVYAVKGRGDANDSVSQIGYSYTCNKCFSIQYIPSLIQNQVTCCGKQTQVAGPLWTGELASSSWVEAGLVLLNELETPDASYELMLSNPKRMKKYLTEAHEGKGLKGYFTSDVISKSLHISQPSFKKIQDLLETSGYRFVKTQFTKHSFRTDAPGTEIIKIFQDHANGEN